MTVLITGGAGYIGSHAAFTLMEAGEAVLVLDNLTTGSRAALDDDVRFVNGNVGDRELVTALLKQYEIETIIHFAGSKTVPESVRDPLLYYRNNTSNSIALIEASIKCGIRHLIFSSTAAVYGNTSNGPVSEDAALQPLSPYGFSKLIVERVLHDVGVAHEMSFVVLRYFNVAGANARVRTDHRRPRERQLIEVAAEAAAGKRNALKVFGSDYPTRDGTCVRDYIHVLDLVHAHIQALHYLRNGNPSVVLNCGYGRGTSVLEVINTAKQLSGRDFKVEMVGRRPGDPPYVVADSTLIRSTLDWKPKYDRLDLIMLDAMQRERRI
jgi:UDP-glucose 4-epimerase